MMGTIYTHNSLFSCYVVLSHEGHCTSSLPPSATSVSIVTSASHSIHSLNAVKRSHTIIIMRPLINLPTILFY